MSADTSTVKANPYERPAYRWYVVTLLAVAYAVS